MPGASHTIEIDAGTYLRDTATINIVGLRKANIGQSAQSGEWKLGRWSKYGVGETAHTRVFYWLGAVWVELVSSLRAKAVASARLRALILA